MSSCFIISLFILMHAIKLSASNNNAQAPNILFVLTDDWGINDVGWTNDNTEIQTPFLNQLATTESIILSNYYVQRVCTATRASFLTGRYPSRLGLQAGVFHQNQPFSLTRQVSMLSNEFQANGYATHTIGKWHLGYQSYEYTPTYRGFDTFYGFWNGGESYYTHRSSIHYDDDTGPPLNANDLYINEYPAINNPYDNVYGVWWQRDEALNLLKYYANTPNTPPFFFYFALQASHNPREAPDEYTALYDTTAPDANMDRITMKAQTTSVDDAMRDIITYMKDHGSLWDNTLIVFGSDNGGKKTIGDNAPYRGFKNTSWEGGIKVAGFITGGVLEQDRKGTVYADAMHITDWYPTLLHAAGLDVQYKRSTKLYTTDTHQIEDIRWDDTEEQPLDGVDQWDYIQFGVDNDQNEDREILLDLCDVWCRYASCGALKIGRFKYIRGNNIASLIPDYEDGDQWERGFARDPEVSESFCTAEKTVFSEYHGVVFDGGTMINSIGCQDTEQGCLFDLELDPCEYYDLSMIYPDLLQRFQDRLDEFQEDAVVALMGENNENELVQRDTIDPRKVCSNTMYWCPYQTYESVMWEEMLFANMEEDGQDEMDETPQIGLFAYMCLYLSVCVGLVLVCKHERNKQNGHFINQNGSLSLHELQPLVVH
eukprot:433618_1